jgi:hypothetical protein
MSVARIIASNPSAARYTARTLHEAGYEVEIVPPGAAANPAAEIVFDLDADKMLSINTDQYVPGQREFVGKPVWRKFTAKRKTEETIARAMRAYPRQGGSSPKQEAAATKAAVTNSPVVAGPDHPAISAQKAAEQAARLETERIALEERRAEEAKIARMAELGRVRAEEAERLRAEQLRVQQEQEAARQLDLEAQRAELRRQQQAQELEAARKREREEREMIARKQEEARERAEEIRREGEAKRQAEAAYQLRLEEQRAEALRREALQREADEAHRSDVMRQRQDEEIARKAEAQRLLLEANRRREESAREREVVAEPVVAKNGGQMPTLSQYLALRLQQRSETRAAKSRSKITRIDRPGRSAWRQAWPITAGVAALCLIGWGIASYRDAAPAATSQDKPPILTPGQYAPYPVATPVSAPAAKQQAHKARRSAVRGQDVADDEVVVHHYYPSKAATAQNRTPQHGKKITDLQ